MKMKIEEVRVGQRARLAMGDIASLAQSIEKIGLIQPIVVDPQGVLICGHRRLEAVKQLGWQLVDARTVQTSAETIDALLMEKDENDQRKPFTPSEAIAMKRLIEGKYREESANRRNSQLVAKNARYGTSSITGENNSVRGTARDLVAAAIGIGSFHTVNSAENVVDHGVPELIQAMDNGVIPIKTAEKISSLSPEEQREALNGGKNVVRQRAREVDAARKRERLAKLESATQASPDDTHPRTQQRTKAGTKPIPEHQVPQMSAMVQRAKIMAAMDYLIASDPKSLPVLHEIMARCQLLINRFTQERA